MDLNALQAELEKKFLPSATGDLDAVICLAIQTEKLTFRIVQQRLEFINSEHSDVTFYFEDIDVARDLLTGHRDVLKSFMEGRFRADGYLMWAFVLIAMFRKNPGQ